MDRSLCQRQGMDKEKREIRKLEFEISAGLAFSHLKFLSLQLFQYLHQGGASVYQSVDSRGLFAPHLKFH